MQSQLSFKKITIGALILGLCSSCMPPHKNDKSAFNNLSAFNIFSDSKSLQASPPPTVQSSAPQQNQQDMRVTGTQRKDQNNLSSTISPPTVIKSLATQQKSSIEKKDAHKNAQKDAHKDAKKDAKMNDKKNLKHDNPSRKNKDHEQSKNKASNGTHYKWNKAAFNGTNFNGNHLNGAHSNGTHFNGTNFNGTHSNGTHFNGTTHQTNKA